MYCWSVFIQSQQCETVRAAAVVTVQNLLHGLVAHLSSGEPLQGHDGGVGPVAQQQLAGLDVTSQRGSMKSRLTERVHSVHLQPEELKSTHRSQITEPSGNVQTKTDLCSVFLQHLQDIIVSPLSSNMQGGHEA